MKRLAFLGITTILLFATGLFMSPVAGVTNGQPDLDGHPYVGLVLFYDDTMTPMWRCSGTLISSTVFVTAGHCTTTTYRAQVWFDPGPITVDSSYHGGPCTVSITGYPCAGGVKGNPYAHPGYVNPYGPGLVRFDTHDVGVVVLDTPVTMSNYGLLPSPGQVDGLAMGTEITLVGYGVSVELRGHGQPVWTGPRTRMFAPTLLVASEDRISNEYIKLTANPAQGKGGTCFGDSGGPDFIAGTRTFLAVNSFVTNGNCAGVTYSNRIDTDYALSFINSFLTGTYLNGHWLLSFDSTLYSGGNPYVHDMFVNGAAATGGWPAGASSYTNTWTATFLVTGNTVTIHATYQLGSATYPYEFTATATIDPGGTTMSSGTWQDTLGDSGTWSATKV